MNKDFYRRLDRAIALANEHERELLSHPGVIAVGAGPERRKGKLTGEVAIVVTVREKIGPKELEARGEKPLPSRVGDVAIDVIERGKPVEAPEIIAAQERARAVLQKHQEKLLKTPNVTGIGVGYKTVSGQMDFSLIALKVFVAKKLSPQELKRQHLSEIPGKLEGVVTDVEEMPAVRPSGASGSRDDRKDPLVGGLTVGVNTKPFWYGTLGAIVFDRTTGEQMVLSNQHIFDGAPGTEVVQPSPIGLDDSLEIGFQLDICNPLHFFRLDTPNTTVGTVLAGAAVAAAVAAALSDEIDPTRRGQDATVPPAGAKTVLERHEVRLEYPDMPIPGTHFKVKTGWQYTRHTDAGDFVYGVEELKENPHALAAKLLLTDKKLYRPGETIRLYGLILPEACAPKRSGDDHQRPINAAELKTLTRRVNMTPPNLSAAFATGIANADPDGHRHEAIASVAAPRCRCDCYHVTALLTPTSVDRAFPVVLREPTARLRAELLGQALEVGKRRDDKDLLSLLHLLVRYGCLYTGELTVGDVPIGPWKHYLFVQTVNCATEGMKPTEAARIIGGLPVSQNSSPQLDVACGPFVLEDGQFDIELI